MFNVQAHLKPGVTTCGLITSRKCINVLDQNGTKLMNLLICIDS